VSHRESLTAHFGRLDLPPDAAAWLLNLWDVIQVFDDLYDRDEVSRHAVLTTVWRVLVAMPANPFYKVNEPHLSPIIANALFKWQAANVAEDDNAPTEVSFVWRAAFYDVVLMVVALCHGPDKALEMAHDVMGLYGEKYADYLKEFDYA
jgi:hypothetical protein